MKQAKLFIITALIILLSGCSEQSSKTVKESSHPNILFIFADDQTYMGLRTMGNDEIITPNLDHLAESGITFTHTFNMGAWNGAVCVASRSMLNTGRTLWRAHDASRQHYAGMADKQQFWSQLMQNAGYQTFMTGKWHVDQDAAALFQTVADIRPGMPKTVPEAYNRPGTENDSTWMPWHRQYGGFWEGGKHWSEVVADHAIEFLDTAKKQEKPFFMYLAFNAPHDPRQSPKKFVEQYPLENITVPRSFVELYPHRNEIGCGEDLRDEKLAPFPRTKYAVKVHRQEYYSIITHMDDQIGRIIAHLKTSGQYENTCILFSADHGLAVGNHGLMGKQNMYDHSMRVPCILVGPGIPENEKRTMQVYVQDLMATALDLADIEKPEYVEFNSLMPLVEEPSRQSPYSEIYGAYLNLQRMVRTDEFKLILYPQAKKRLLFDLQNDPLELKNLADDAALYSVMQDLAKRLSKQQQIMNDTLNLHAYFPELF